MSFDPPSTASARTPRRLYELARVPWGDPPGIPEILVPEATDSRSTGELPRTRRAPVRLRLSPDGSFGLLAADPLTRSTLPPQLLQLTADGALRRLEVRPPSGDGLQWQILDFAFDQAANAYLLELVTARDDATTVLRKLTPGGAEAWSRSRPWRLGVDGASLGGSPYRLLTGAGAAVYLSATREGGLVARVDPESGELAPYADLGGWTGDALMGPDESIYFVRFLPERNARAWVRLDPATGEQKQVVCDRAGFELLAFPLGVDAEGNAYGVDGTSLGCVGREGTVVWRETLARDSSAVLEAAGGDRELRWESSSWRVGHDGTLYLPAVGSAGFHLLALGPDRGPR